jgi:catechol 2,3-dioxygenase-like lactoylglutathione lyase family enzyme
MADASAIPAHLDHVVLATPDLHATTAWIKNALGVEPSAGGQHTGRGTRNYLLALGGGSYLEIIGRDADQPDPPAPRSFGIDRLAEPALVAWAVRSAKLEDAVRIAAGHGFDLGTVQAMSRATPDGEVLRWRLTFRQYDGASIVPFFIDWGTTRHPSVTAAGGATLTALRAQHPRPGAVRPLLAALGVGLRVEVGPHERLLASITGPGGSLDLS